MRYDFWRERYDTKNVPLTFSAVYFRRADEPSVMICAILPACRWLVKRFGHDGGSPSSSAANRRVVGVVGRKCARKINMRFSIFQRNSPFFYFQRVIEIAPNHKLP